MPGQVDIIVNAPALAECRDPAVCLDGPSASVLHRLRLRRLVAPALFSLAYFAGAGFAELLAIVPQTGVSVWAPSGLFLATLLNSGRGGWPRWIAAALIAEMAANLLWFHNPLPAALMIFAGNAAEACLGAWLIRRAGLWPKADPSLLDMMALIGIGAGVAPLVSATVGSLTLQLFQLGTAAIAWPLFWIGDLTGVLVVAPLVLCAAGAVEAPPHLSPARVAEALALALVALGIGTVSLGGYLPFAYTTMLQLLWAATRFEFPGAAVATTLLAALTAIFTATGASEFVGTAANQTQKHLMLQLFLASAATIALMVAALARQNRQALKRLRAANLLLETRVAERTATLRDSERRLAAVLDALPTGVALVDAEGRVLLANAGARPYFSATIPSRNDRESGLWSALDDAGRPVAPTDYPGARALRGERVWPGQDFLLTRPDGAPPPGLDSRRGPAGDRRGRPPRRRRDGGQRCRCGEAHARRPARQRAAPAPRPGGRWPRRVGL